MRNSSLYVNPTTTCQTYYDGTYWHIKLYDITSSQLDIDWWIQQFIGEIKGSAQLNAFGVIIHTGKQLKLSTVLLFWKI